MNKGNCLLDTLSSWEVIDKDKISPTKYAASCPSCF